jgi:selenocysteine lyase/cysteine desulfurase
VSGVQVRTDNVDIMKKVFWGGGTVAIATSSDNFHVLKCNPSEKFEDGTVAFLDIVSLPHAFSFIEGLGGINAIQVLPHCLYRSTAVTSDCMASRSSANTHPQGCQADGGAVVCWGYII